MSENLDDIFVDVQSNDVIPTANLFSNLAVNVRKTKAPTKVLLEGQAGIGKTTVAKNCFLSELLLNGLILGLR